MKSSLERHTTIITYFIYYYIIYTLYDPQKHINIQGIEVE